MLVCCDFDGLGYAVVALPDDELDDGDGEWLYVCCEDGLCSEIFGWELDNVLDGETISKRGESLEHLLSVDVNAAYGCFVLAVDEFAEDSCC